MAAMTNAQRRRYELLYESCLCRPKRKASVNALAKKIRANRKRYEKVGKAVGVPWYVVGIVHSLEASGNFTRHLHNGDPLTARTVHVPAGRPKTGRPPFTWEQSAIDALRGRGLGAWKDWSVPGTLYQLEAYNGFGYRDHHPNVPSPYLWSFSTHYTRGKYVADGRFSASAVSQQVGAALLLKQLVGSPQNGRVAIPTGPRILQLANPPVKGPDVLAAQKLLLKNPFGSFNPGKLDSEYGEITAGAVIRAKWELGFPATARSSTFGPNLKAFLSGKKPLPAAFKARRATRLKQATSQQAIRKRIVNWALWGCKNTARSATRRTATSASPRSAIRGTLPLATDCSAFATLCYSWAGAPNPNASGAFDARQPAFTGRCSATAAASRAARCSRATSSCGRLPASGSTSALSSRAAPTRCSSHTATSRARRSCASPPRTTTSGATGTAPLSGSSAF
jgi:lysozyme family protein